MGDSIQRQALARDLARRLQLASHDEARVIDRVLQRLELGRERYGELDLAKDARDWRRERFEELLDEIVYRACEELQAEDLERRGLREAARAEMLGVERPMFERPRVHFEHPGHNGVADLGPATDGLHAHVTGHANFITPPVGTIADVDPEDEFGGEGG